MANPIPVVRRISEATRIRTSRDLANAQTDALDRVLAQPEPFGLNGLYEKDSELATNVEKLLGPYVQQYLLNFFKNSPDDKGKSSKAWAAYLPREMTACEVAAAQEALSPKYYWGDFMALPEVRKALVEDAALAFVDTLTNTAGFLKNEAELVEQWKTKRPQYYEFANMNALDYITKNFSQAEREDPECREGLQAVWLNRVAAFRYLDAHFTGEQHFVPSPQFGNLTSITRKLQFDYSLHDYSQQDRQTLDKRLCYIKLGSVELAEYGTSKRVSDAVFLEKLYAETKRIPGQKFNFNNPVIQVAALLCPILTFPPDKIKQKELNSVKFLYGVYKLAKELEDEKLKSKLPTDLRDVYIDPSALPQGVVSRFDPEWLRKHFLSPAWIKFAGFAPYIQSKRITAFKKVVEGLPNLAEQLAKEETVEKLVLQRTKAIVLNPVSSRCIQRECYTALKLLYPKDAERIIAEVTAKQKPKEERDEKENLKFRFDLFDATLAFLLDNEYPERQLKVYEHFQKSFNFVEFVPTPKFVDAPLDTKWLHPSTLGMEPSTP